MLMKFDSIKWKTCKKNICKEKQNKNEKKQKYIINVIN